MTIIWWNSLDISLMYSSSALFLFRPVQISQMSVYKGHLEIDRSEIVIDCIWNILIWRSVPYLRLCEAQAERLIKTLRYKPVRLGSVDLNYCDGSLKGKIWTTDGSILFQKHHLLIFRLTTESGELHKITAVWQWRPQFYNPSTTH